MSRMYLPEKHAVQLNRTAHLLHLIDPDGKRYAILCQLI
jgi:hypothetical protein